MLPTMFDSGAIYIVVSFQTCHILSVLCHTRIAHIPFYATLPINNFVTGSKRDIQYQLYHAVTACQTQVCKTSRSLFQDINPGSSVLIVATGINGKKAFNVMNIKFVPFVSTFDQQLSEDV